MGSADPPPLRELVPGLGLEEGDVLDGAYRLGPVIGWGGMSAVLAASRLEDGRPVAVKFLRSPGDERMVARLLREAELAASVRGPHFVEVLDVGRTTTGVPYFVMERLEGETLEQLSTRCGPLAPGSAAHLVSRACEGLALAHARGIVHRDVKPSNLFLARTAGSRESELKILDLGIARLDDAPPSAQGLTTESTLLGTPAYASPEQLDAAHDVDARADVWSLGVTLYYLIAGVRPFNGGSLPQLCAAIFNETPRRLDDVRPEVPSGLADVVARCMAKRREDRYSDVDALAAALAPFISEAVVTLSGVLVTPTGGDARRLVRHEPATFGRRSAHRRGSPRRAMVVGAVLGTAVLAAGGAYFAIGRADGEPPTAGVAAVSGERPAGTASEPGLVASVAPDPVAEREPAEVPSAAAPRHGPRPAIKTRPAAPSRSGPPATSRAGRVTTTTADPKPTDPGSYR